MRILSLPNYQTLIDQSRVLARDLHGDKVLHLSDGRMIKLFRRKRFLSTALFWSPARRFRAHARALEKRGIATVSQVSCFRIPELEREAVLYQPLTGETLREAGRQRGPEVLRELPAFIAHLHGLGIYFRSLHAGNLLLLPQGGFGLIDVLDLSIAFFPLTVGKRLRNFRHFLRIPEDLALFEAYGAERFLDEYLAAWGGKGERFRRALLDLTELDAGLRPKSFQRPRGPGG